MIKIIFLLIFFTTNFRFCYGKSWKDKIKDLKKEASILKTHVKSIVQKNDDDQIGFTSNSELDYPQGDLNKQKQINDLWEEYYKCQDTLVVGMGPKRRIIPTAAVVLLGGYLKLNCDICTSPRDIDIETEWYFSNSLEMNNLQPLMFNEFIIVSPLDDSLQIFNIHQQQSGLYVCKQGNNSASPIIVHVFEDETFTEVHPNTAPGNQALKSITISKLEIIISSQWGDWTECSECGKVGRRSRLGICYVNLIEDDGETAIPQDSGSNTQNNLTATGIVNRSKLEILDIFVNGIPCRSKLLPKFIRDSWEVKSRPSEVMIGYCKVPCLDSTNILLLNCLLCQ
uniref:Ig-like domain-containing protein n=1 Tax=Clastoptera arizonana TaxID=38151 RepID=A0A1B6D024_9HEMI